MAETAAPHARPRRRRWPYALLALVLLAGVGAFAVRHYTRPERLTALLVGQARSQFGLELSLDGAARFGFLPSLRLRLPKPSAGADGAAVLDAASIDVVVPWRTLWGERVDIERISMERPRLDLDAFSRWLAARPSGGAAPEVRFAVQVRDGTLLASGKPLAEGLNLEFANAGDLAAWLERVRAADAPLLPPLSGSAEAARVQIGGTRVEGLRVELRDDAAPAPTR